MSASEAQSSSPASNLPRCPCGHDRNHYMVSAEPKYGLFKLLVVSMGISQQPHAIEYRCRRCNKVFDRTTDIPKKVQEDR